MSRAQKPPERGRVVTTRTVLMMKKSGEKIAMLTAYDYLVARLLDEVGVDVILVGDSLGNVIQGHETTLPVTVDDMIYHAKAVKRGVRQALVVVDMPFMSYQTSVDDAVRNCGRVMKEVGAGAVKLEGGEFVAEIAAHLVKIGIPVMGHLGLTPQAINTFGTYEVRATDKGRSDAAGARCQVACRGRGLCLRAGEDTVGARTKGDQRDPHPDDRHRRRTALRRSGACGVRYAGPDRGVQAPVRPPVR